MTAVCATRSDSLRNRRIPAKARRLTIKVPHGVCGVARQSPLTSTPDSSLPPPDSPSAPPHSISAPADNPRMNCFVSNQDATSIGSAIPSTDGWSQDCVIPKRRPHLRSDAHNCVVYTCAASQPSRCSPLSRVWFHPIPQPEDDGMSRMINLFVIGHPVIHRDNTVFRGNIVTSCGNKLVDTCVAPQT